jgi:hypothetical protein
MASVLTDKEISSLVKKMDSYREQIATDPKAVQDLLRLAGIKLKKKPGDTIKVKNNAAITGKF